MSSLRFVFVLAAAILLVSMNKPVLAIEGGERAYSHFVKTEPNPNKRVLNFPAEKAVGLIGISTDLFVDPYGSSKIPARGTVTIPAGKFATFMPNHRFYQNPTILNKLPADSFDRIEISFQSMTDSEDSLCAKAIEAVAHFDGMSQLILDRSDVTDVQLDSIKNLRKLQILNAFGTALSGACFKNFGSLKNLQYMDLQASGILDKNIEYLANVPNLKYLNIGHSNISDAGVNGLAANKELQFLDLGENPKITDASIPLLRGLPHLRHLVISQTSITCKGVAKLKGLPIASIIMPATFLTRDQLIALQKTFPGAAIMPTRTHRQINKETDELFSPLH